MDQIIASAVRSAGLDLSDAQVERLVSHAELVIDANRTMNLTRITAPEAVATLHVVDSLMPLGFAGELAEPIVDIGSGAGYPGIPLCIATGRRVILCESVKKKAAFLSDCVQALDLDCEVFPGRAEDLAAQRPGGAGVVTARAVSNLGSLIELASPLLRTGGRLIALKGRPEEDEVSHAEQTARMCGMMREAVYDYRLPDTGEQRTVYIYVRSGHPEVRLPRRPGLAQKQPLVPR